MPEIAGPEWNLSGILRRFRRIRNSEDRFYPPPSSFSPFLRFPLSFCLSRSGFRADSIKRLFVATKRRVKRFVRDASRLSLSSLSFLLSFFSLRSSFPSASSVFFVPLCYRCRKFEIYKHQRVFQGRASGSEDKDAPARMPCLGDLQ